MAKPKTSNMKEKPITTKVENDKAAKKGKDEDKTATHRVHPVQSIKRLSSTITTRKTTAQAKISEDFTDYRKRLDHAETTLRQGLKQYDELKSCWDGVGKNMELFNEGLLGATSDDANNKALFRNGYDGAVAFRRDVTTTINGTTGDSSITKNKGLDIVNEYLKDVEELKKEYPNVERLWSEMERYKRKNNRIEKRKSIKEEKKLRSVTKMDNSRKAYHTSVDECVEKMKKIFDKYPEICKALYYGYWKHQNDYSIALAKETTSLQTKAQQEITILKPVPKKPAPPVVLPKTEASDDAKPPKETTTAPKEPEITASQDPKTVIAPSTETATPPVKTEEAEKTASSEETPKAQDAPPVKKMEEKITDAAKIAKENEKPIAVSKIKEEVPPGGKSPSKFTKAARLPSFKKIFRRSAQTTSTSAATSAPTAA